jgi:hypothetical protein
MLRAEQGGRGLGRARATVVHQDNEGGEADRVGEEHALVVGIVGGFADAVEEVDDKVVLVLGEPDLARKGVEVADKGSHQLPKAGIGRARHGA